MKRLPSHPFRARWLGVPVTEAGEMPALGDNASLFIDIIGTSLTPLSFAGARRRVYRRHAPLIIRAAGLRRSAQGPTAAPTTLK